MINLDTEHIKKYPGIDVESVIKVTDLLNTEIKKRNSPLFIFIDPDIKKWSDKINLDEKNIFLALKYLSCNFNQIVKFKYIFSFAPDGLEYPLQDDDIFELKNFGTVHNPNNPNIVYKEAHNYIRQAFLIHHESNR